MSAPLTDRGYEAYERARDAVLAMQRRTRPAGDARPSAYWTEELENFDYMIEATPLIVRKLRHHSFHITGIRPYDYRVKDNARRTNFEARLAALRDAGGDALLVPEHPALGGFGYEIDGRLFNVDTLKFYEVLIGMQRAGVLDAVRGAGRPLVCEVGSGWGGFAYQFKTLFPRSTYVIVDFPELFLFSATYLGAVFPDARIVFATDGAADWRNADFVFVPNDRADIVASLPLDLVLNMVSFQEMTEAQVRGYAEMAAAARCPRIYSLNRERSPYNTELTAVSRALAAHYALTEVEVLGSDYTTAFKGAPKPSKQAPRGEFGYRHLAGQLRADGPRVVLGMTLHNNAAHLPGALDSLLAQTHTEFRLVMLDDGSSDDTERIARAYVARDARLSFARHPARQGMIATWREVVEIAARDWPSAELFAWVSDHDRWHPQWLERLVRELDTHPSAVLAYPITRRMSPDGADVDKGPRLFDTSGADDLMSRWRQYCHHGVGAGDMVYGLVRIAALQACGIFRPVLRPDRLLITELALHGHIRQVPEVLWFRRNATAASVARQRHTLMLPGTEPPWFNWPPWLQHTIVLRREYGPGGPQALAVSPWQWRGMLLRYQLTYGWRHFRKSETVHALNRGIDHGIRAWKLTKHYYRHAVYALLVGGRTAWGRTRRATRRGVHHTLVLTHRVGLRGRGETPSR